MTKYITVDTHELHRQTLILGLRPVAELEDWELLEDAIHPHLRHKPTGGVVEVLDSPNSGYRDHFIGKAFTGLFWAGMGVFDNAVHAAVHIEKGCPDVALAAEASEQASDDAQELARISQESGDKISAREFILSHVREGWTTRECLTGNQDSRFRVDDLQRRYPCGSVAVVERFDCCATRQCDGIYVVQIALKRSTSMSYGSPKRYASFRDMLSAQIWADMVVADGGASTARESSEILRNKLTLENRSEAESPEGYIWAGINRPGLQGWTLHRIGDRQIVAGVERLDGGAWVPFIIGTDGHRRNYQGYTGFSAGEKSRVFICEIVSVWVKDSHDETAANV